MRDQAPWDLIVMKAFDSSGGKANLRYVYAFIERNRDNFLMDDYHFRDTEKYGGRAPFQHIVRSVITTRSSGLMAKGLLVRIGPVGSGEYELTERGRQFLRDVGPLPWED
jgi:hypothetical protein